MSTLWPEAKWRSLALSLTAAVAGAFSPPAVIASVSQELIALFGLLLAGALPTMILTATILRAGAFSPKRVGDYGVALERQLTFWFSLFLWAMGACIAITLSKALWDENSPYVILIPNWMFNTFDRAVPDIELTRLFNTALGVCAAQVSFRLLPMLSGLQSLLRLNSLIATEEAVENAKKSTESGGLEIKAMQPPTGHGNIVDN